MAKAGKNKKACEKYRQQGRREKNKKLKQERAAKRLEYFRRKKERREAGVEPGSAPEVINESEVPQEVNVSNSPKDTRFSRMRSIMQKLKNEKDAARAEEKRKESGK